MSLANARLLLTVLLLTLPSLAAGQEPAPAPTEDTAMTKHAFELLDLVAENVSSLRSLDNRVYVASTLADLLWTRDEKRARGLFDTVTKEMVAALSELEETREQQPEHRMSAFQQQRRELLELLAQRDPQMALSFLRATRLPANSEHRSGDFYENETNLEIHLAGLVASRDPQQAMEMARSILQKRVASQLTALLFQIAAKDQDAARILHKEIVARIKSEDLSTNHAAANAGWNLLVSFPPPQADEVAYRELLESLTSHFRASSSNTDPRRSYVQNFQHLLNSAMPQIEKYAPARVSALRQLIQTTQQHTDPSVRLHQQLSELTQKGTVDDLLTMASRQSPDFQLQIYQQAMWKALNSGDEARARQIASELITDPRQRRQMLEQIDSHLLWKVIGENKTAEARQLLSKSRNIEHRLQVLVNLAAAAGSRGDKSLALELLAEARALIENLPANLSKLNGQLQVAQGYSTLDTDQCSALIQPIIALVNQYVSAAVVLDGIEKRYLQDGEWTKRSYSGLGNLVSNLQQNLSFLARQDPAKARLLATEFERPEIRIISQLEIARALLGGQHMPLPAGRRGIRDYFRRGRGVTR